MRKMIGRGWCGVVWSLLLGGLVSAQPLLGQHPRELSDEDAVQLRLQTLEAVLDTLGVRRGEGPLPTIWLLPGREVDPETGERAETGYSDADVTRLQAVVPEIRVPDVDGDDLFLCPPGERVMMPISGCPIRDDGVIARLGVPRMEGDTAVVWGSVTQSGTDGERTWTWMEGLELVFLPGDGRWDLVGVRSRIET